ncbi:MAG: hypothetical protein ACPKPY_10435 [Nitrososphaeraceae archaeon]
MSDSNNEIQIEKRIHPIWTDFSQADLKSYIQHGPAIGKYQYILTSKKGQISIAELPDQSKNGITFWELYCLDGDLFEDKQRLHSYKEAEQTARKYLE